MNTNVKEMEQVPIDCIQLSKVGRVYFNVAKELSGEVLRKQFGEKIPKPQAAMAEDGRLLLWWDINDWPLYITIDEGQWRLR